MRLRSILVHGRGEIACRIVRTCRRLGLRTVAVYSEADARAPHVRAADQAVCLGRGPLAESYLDVARVLEALVATRVDALHPGYGFLSEDADFARAVQQTGALFIGPEPEILARLADKGAARQLAAALGIPVLPASSVPLDPARLGAEAERVGLPLLVKPLAAGGGMGLELVADRAGLEAAVARARMRARGVGGDDRVFLERFLEPCRHIEAQIVADGQGRAWFLGERECSVQRRYQKLIEESPSPAWPFAGGAGEARRTELAEYALRLVDATGYRGIGTVEFLADQEGRWYFLEVNPRLQVEHPVTEARTGLDLVELQLRLAAGETLPERMPEPSGHAIEARIYAEDPARGLLPQPGTISRLRWPAGVRIDSGIEVGNEVSPYYDPLLAKVIAHGPDRRSAVDALLRALGDTEVEVLGPRGPRSTNLELLRALLVSPEFASGEYDTSLVGRVMSRRSEWSRGARLGGESPASGPARVSVSDGAERSGISASDGTERSGSGPDGGGEPFRSGRVQ